MSEKSQIPPATDQGRTIVETTTTLEPPKASDITLQARNPLDSQERLPPHWEELSDSDGGTFYANHIARTTARQKPKAETLEDGSNTLSRLPVAWEALRDSEGRTYYANHASRTTSFEKPENLTGELPKGWEILRTPGGVAYFVDHNTRTVTWNDPTHPEG